MPCLSLRRAITLFVLFAAVFESSLASILADDYALDWIKAKDSKRKIQTSVAWKKDERLFGSDAANIVSDAPATFCAWSDQTQASRFPQDSFYSLNTLNAHHTTQTTSHLSLPPPPLRFLRLTAKPLR
ncbi:hypothetical protein DFH29DRAFT_186660 [Suillus ampliporus]|nr:hypothetical protein DFH29DRAFT_186660 [Suillus ampliporus]